MNATLDLLSSITQRQTRSLNPLYQFDVHTPCQSTYKQLIRLLPIDFSHEMHCKLKQPQLPPLSPDQKQHSCSSSPPYHHQ